MDNDIDLVYLWVDGSDPKWQAKFEAFAGKTKENNPVSNKARFTNSDELKYSLRSVEKYAPWFRKIFIVTNDQTPAWLDTANSKIKVVDHKEILPTESLPCFSSTVIETFLYKIPSLAERFVYTNDDMFIGKPILPETFFAADGFPLIRFKKRLFRNIQWFWRADVGKPSLDWYEQAIHNATKLAKTKYRFDSNSLPHHNMDAMLRSDFQRNVEETFKKQFETMATYRMRHPKDILRTIHQYVAIAEKRGHLLYVKYKDSTTISIDKKDHFARLEANKPTFFCMNDNENATDDDRLYAQEFLKRLFPDKSEFEI